MPHIPAVGSPAADDEVAVHRALRREVRLVPHLVRGVRAGDRTRARVVADHTDDVLAALRAHLAADWTLLLPAVGGGDSHGDPNGDPNGDSDAELLRRARRNHRTVSAAVDRTAELVPPWRRSAGADDGGELAHAAEALRTLVLRHLAEEEQQVLALVGERFSAAEWSRFGRYEVRQMPRARLVTQLGSVLEDADTAERHALLARFPVGTRAHWTLFGRRRYTRHVRLVRHCG